MKKSYSLLLQFAFVGSVFAQPSITSTEFNPAAGLTFTGTQFDASIVSPGASGTGVTWNFSTLPSTGSFSNGYISPSSTTYAASYPTATSALLLTAGYYNYYLHNTTGYYNLGVGSPASIIALSNSEQLYSYPFTYTTTWSDAFSGAWSGSGYTATRSGTISAIVDGFGTLMIPSGTYSNILRVKLVENYQDDLDFSGTPITYLYDNTIYHYIMENVHYPVVVHTTATTTVSGSPTTGYSGLILDASFLGTSEEDEMAAAFSLYPNPSTDGQVQLVLNFTKNENMNVNIFNTFGQLVFQKTMTVTNGFNNTMLDLKDLEHGVYCVELFNSTTKATKKLVME